MICLPIAHVYCHHNDMICCSYHYLIHWYVWTMADEIHSWHCARQAFYIIRFGVITWLTTSVYILHYCRHDVHRSTSCSFLLYLIHPHVWTMADSHRSDYDIYIIQFGLIPWQTTVFEFCKSFIYIMELGINIWTLEDTSVFCKTIVSKICFFECCYSFMSKHPYWFWTVWTLFTYVHDLSHTNETTRLLQFEQHRRINTLIGSESFERFSQYFWRMYMIYPTQMKLQDFCNLNNIAE